MARLTRWLCSLLARCWPSRFYKLPDEFKPYFGED